MLSQPDGHGIYRNDHHPNNVYSQATKKEAYERDEEGMHNATPLGFLPYPTKVDKVVLEDPDQVRKVVQEAASRIVERANNTRMTNDGVKAMIRVEQERIFEILREAAVRKLKSKTAGSSKVLKPRHTATRRRVVDKKAAKSSANKPKPRMRATG